MRNLIEKRIFSEAFDGSILIGITKQTYKEYQLAENLEKKHNKDDQMKTLASGDLNKFIKEYSEYKVRNGNFALYIMAQWGDGNGGDSSRKIKNGEYRVDDWVYGFELLKKLDDINCELKKNTNKRIGAHTYNSLYSMLCNKRYDHGRFMSKLKVFFNTESNILKWKNLPKNVTAQQMFLMEVYNYKVKSNYENLF